MPDLVTEDEIKLSFRVILGREPDPTGLAYFLRFVKERDIRDVRLVGQALLDSPEFKRGERRYGARLFEDLRPAEFDGVKFILPVTDFTYSSLSVSGVYEPYVTGHMFPHLSEGQVFLDIGANLGLFSLPAARRVGPSGKVIAFEASAANAKLLLQNAERNSINNIDIFPIGAGETNGVAYFYANDASSNHALSYSLGRFQPDEVEIAPVVRLDDFLSPHQRIDVMKVDVEGFEYRVFKGAAKVIQRNKPRLYVEYSDQFQRNMSGVSGVDLLRLLLGWSYTVTILRRTGEPEVVTGETIEDVIKRIESVAADDMAVASHLDLYLEPV